MKNQKKSIQKSSRIIIKNLPPDFDENSLAQILQQFGQLTDCRIQFKGDTNRRFGYAGYMDTESAFNAIKNLNQTFIKKFKVTVQFSFLKKKQLSNKQQKQDDIEYDNKRIYVTNFPFTVSEDQLENLFKPFGMIKELKILRRDGKSLGRGFVTFDDSNSVIKVLADLDNKICFGRILHIQQCRAKDNQQPNSDQTKIIDQQKSSFKKVQKKEMFQKIHDNTNWNSFFLNPNSVVDLMSKKLQLKKKELLDKDIENPAMVQALIEKEILDDTKDFLSKQGVDLDTLNQKPSETERSSKIMLVKNIPADTKIPKLRQLFEVYGQLSKFLVPQVKSIVVVEYQNIENAMNAYEALQNYKFQATPIYLEWAPKNFFFMEAPQSNLLVKKSQEEALQQNEHSQTVFVKNLSFQTTEEILEQFIKNSNLKGLQRVKIVMKDGQSKGFGFATFDSVENAKEMLKKLQNKTLEKHALQLSMSQRKKETDTKQSEENKPSDKLMIKNIPFQTNKQELKQLFDNVIEFKKLRVPKKLDGNLKGYAFLEFNSIQDCQKAKLELNNIHFYGRKLVLEYAKE